LGATTENLIKFPDNLPNALSFMEGANAYLTFVTTDGSEGISILQDIYTDRWLNHDTNTFMGVGVCGDGNLAHAAGSQGWHNVAIGYKCLESITDGERNVALGSEALILNEDGEYNMAIGAFTLWQNISGCQNIAIGGDALLQNLASYNIALGKAALYLNQWGGGNTAIGTGALYTNNWGSYNIAIGMQAMSSPSNPAQNVCIGYQAGLGTANTYNYNVLIGTRTGFSLTTGSDNICIGQEAGYNLTSGTGNVCIGHDAAKGQLTTGNNQLWIANSNTATPLIYGEFDNAFLKINNHIYMLERSADPAEPAEGEMVIWMSDGTQKGDDGDVLIASKAGGATTVTTVHDHSAGAAW